MRADGRLRLRIDLPPDVVSTAGRIATETGAEREVVLGDLAAVALSGLLAEVAEDLVGRAARRRLGARTARVDAPPAVVAETARELLTSENAETPGADSRGLISISPKILAPASIAPGRPSGKPRGDAGTT
jgi:hypothetical protein